MFFKSLPKGVVEYIYDSGVWEVQAERWAQGHPLHHTKFEASLGYKIILSQKVIKRNRIASISLKSRHLIIIWLPFLADFLWQVNQTWDSSWRPSVQSTKEVYVAIRSTFSILSVTTAVTCCSRVPETSG